MWVEPSVFREYMASITRKSHVSRHRPRRLRERTRRERPHLREVGASLRQEEVAYGIEWMWNESIRTSSTTCSNRTGHTVAPKETAMIQYLHSALVHEDRLAEARDGGMPSVDDAEMRRHGSRTFYDAADNTDNGVLGDQTDATAEKGEQLFETATDHGPPHRLARRPGFRGPAAERPRLGGAFAGPADDADSRRPARARSPSTAFQSLSPRESTAFATDVEGRISPKYLRPGRPRRLEHRVQVVVA